MLTPGTLAALATGGLAAVVDWTAVLRADRRMEGLAKPAVMACLIVAVLLGPTGAPPGQSLAHWFLVAALAASLAGDWLLLPPVRFTAGLVAFLVAHIAYLAIFLLMPLALGGALVGVGGTVAMLVLVGREIIRGASRAGAGLPVGVYLAAICAMAVAATASGSPVAAGGAWLFVASDAMLGRDRFVALPAATAGGTARRRLAVMVTYHAAQALLVVGILRLSVS